MKSAAGATPVASRPSMLRRLRRNRTALLSAAGLGLLYCAGVLTLPFSIAWHDLQSLEHVRHPPQGVNPVLFDEHAARQLEVAPAGSSLGSLGPAFFGVAGLLGFDNLGRSLFYRCLLGGTISLTIGLAAATLAVCVGVLWGATAGLAGGVIDQIMMRLVDIFYGIPSLLVVILMKLALDAPLHEAMGNSQLSNIVILLVAIASNSWLTMARVVRGQVLSLKERPFVEAARSYGAGWFRILTRHLLPNLTGPIAVYGSLIVPQAILSESFLSFLGIGIQRPIPTWGSLVADGLQAVNSVVNDWWLILFPCALLSLTLLAMNFIGDGLRQALDPRAGDSS